MTADEIDWLVEQTLAHERAEQRAAIAQDREDTPHRCEACQFVGETVRWYTVPTGFQFRFCLKCRVRHGAIEVME